MKLACLFTLVLAFPATMPAGLQAHAEHAPSEPSLGRLFPKRCDFYVEAPGLAQLLDAGLDSPLLQRIEQSELLRSALEESGANLEGLVAFGNLWFKRPLLATVADLGRNGLAVGVDFSGAEPAVLFVLDAADGDALDFTLERIFEMLEKRFGAPGAFDEPHRHTQGTDVWKLGDDGLIGRRGTLLFLSNDRPLFLETLALAQAETNDALASSPAFREARSTCPANTLLWAHVDLARLEERSAKAAAGMEGLRKLPAQPAVQFLLGDAFARLGSADTLTAALTVDGPDVELGLVGQGTDQPSPLAPASSPPAGVAGPRLASAFVYRDLAGIFGTRSELFAARDLPAFARALTELSPLFGGIDIEGELLPCIAPWIELVVDPIPFENAERPETVLPAAALIARLEDPAAGDTLVAAFQTVVSLQNVEAGNRERPTHRLSLALEGEVALYRAVLPKPRPSEGIDVIYNLQPTCAVVGDVFIIGTHESLVRDLVLSQPSEPAPPSRPRGRGREAVHIDAEAVADSLAANRDALIAHKVVSDGVSFEEAEGEIDGLIGLSRLLGEVSLSLKHEDASDTHGKVVLHLESNAKGQRHGR